MWSRCVGASSDDEDDGSETWRCSRVVACGDDERFALRSAGTAGTGANDASRVGAPRLPAVVAARFHPLNADLFFVALSGARSVWAVNQHGRVSARLEASARSVPADLSAACVDAVGAFAYAGDVEGRVLALRYTRADENVFPKRAAFTSLGGRVFAARRSLREPFAKGGSRDPRDAATDPSTPDPSTPKRANAFLGEHAVSFAGSAAPPSAFPRGSLGTEISHVAYAPFARVAGGAAVFATFRCGAVRVYKTTFGESMRVHSARGNAKRSAYSARVVRHRPRDGGRRAALTPALTVRSPRGGVSGVSRPSSRSRPRVTPPARRVRRQCGRRRGDVRAAVGGRRAARVPARSPRRTERVKKTSRRLRAFDGAGETASWVRRRRRVAVETAARREGVSDARVVKRRTASVLVYTRAVSSSLSISIKGVST